MTRMAVIIIDTSSVDKNHLEKPQESESPTETSIAYPTVKKWGSGDK